MSANLPKRPEGWRELHLLESYMLTANMRRIILGGDDLASLNVNNSIIGPHLKMIIPPKDAPLVWPEFNGEMTGKRVWPVWPEGPNRPTVRTYSLRYYDAELKQLTIDLVCHDGGIASDWANNAKPGDKIGLLGPGGKETYRGQWLVLVGDISALPAIAYTLEEVLPADAQGKAIIEVPSQADLIRLKAPAGMEITWLVRNSREESALIDTVTAIELPQGSEPLIWGGMENDLAKGLRNAIKEKMTLSREQYQLVNYWREGVPEGGFSHKSEE